MTNTTNNEVTWAAAEQEVLRGILAAAKNINNLSSPAQGSERLLHLAESLAWLRSHAQSH